MNMLSMYTYVCILIWKNTIVMCNHVEKLVFNYYLYIGGIAVLPSYCLFFTVIIIVFVYRCISYIPQKRS